jgi:two-component system alkaline phosphatase synthesis response regulator PhoP
MESRFCWQHRRCHRACPVRDLRLLRCWTYFQEENQAGLKACDQCDYRLSWQSGMAPGGEGVGIRRGRRQPTVLVVDDEPNILFALEEAVRGEGFSCVGAADGEEGLLIARGIRPDLVITDVIMPGLNGFELCRSLKDDELTRHIPVIIVTVRATEKERLEGILAGADAYLVKPFNGADLREAIDRLMPR